MKTQGQYKQEILFGLMGTRYEEWQRIFNGRQRYVIRLCRPRNVGEGSWMLLYDRGLRAVVGEFLLYGPAQEMSPGQVREAGITDVSGMSQEELEAYAGKRGQVVVMEIGDVIRYRWPVAMAQIRDRVSDFRPPRMFGYLSQWPLRPKDIDYRARYMARRQTDGFVA